MDYDKIQELRGKVWKVKHGLEDVRVLADVVDEVLLELVAPEHTHPTYDVDTPKET